MTPRAETEMERAYLPEVIETERLVLRPFGLGDVDDVLAYARDPEWSRFMRDLPRPYERADAERAVAEHFLMDRRTEPNWAMVLQGRVIGGVVLLLDFEHGSAEVGYSVAREHWNRGFCTEAVSTVIDEAFSTHADLNRVFGRTDTENLASQRVLEKVGMVKEGVLRSSRVQGGVVVDEAYFSVLRSEWER